MRSWGELWILYLCGNGSHQSRLLSSQHRGLTPSIEVPMFCEGSFTDPPPSSPHPPISPPQERVELEPAVSSLRQHVSDAAADLNLGFQFNDPVRGFDRSRVKGMLARLLRIRDAQMAVALEVRGTGGGQQGGEWESGRDGERERVGGRKGGERSGCSV